MTPAETLKLTYGRHVYSDAYQNADGSPQVWKITGKPKTWKTRPNEFKIPIKRGLYEYGYLNEGNVQSFHLTEQGAVNAREEKNKIDHTTGE